MKGDKKYVSVPEFYAGKSVFVTGGSGFLGKVLIEKLLYSCPLVDKIYVLLREKKNVNAEQRFKAMIDLPVFSRLKSENPDALKKLVLVKGELTAKNLDLSSEDLQTVKDKVSIVIHSAATVRFNEPLKIAMAINYEGTKNVLEVCKTLKHIDAFVHVSTTYSNPTRMVVEEKIYPPPATLDEVQKLLEQSKGDEDLTPYLNGWPNTYTYTKALAENLVLETHGDIPTVLVRPSVVTGSLSEPIPGWVDNWFGPTGVMTPLAMGVGRAILSQYDYNIDIIPVDYVCNFVLIAATRATRSPQIPVYHSCSGSTNPISMGYSIKLYTDAGIKEKFNILPFPNMILYTKRRWLMKLTAILMYFIAYAADFLLHIVGRKPRFEKILAQSVKVQESLAFFSCRSWLMKSDKALALAKSLSPEDCNTFPCNPQQIVWEEYVPIYFKGVKKYLIEKQK